MIDVFWVISGFCFYKFRCLACDGAGALKLKVTDRDFSCPECDARYIQWFDSIRRVYSLICVVMPIYERS